MNRVWIPVLAAAMVSCGGPPAPTAQVLIGATLFNSGGKKAVERAVIVVEDERFKAVGDQPTLPIPAGTEKVDLTGRYVIPAPIAAPKSMGWKNFATQGELAKLAGAGEKALRGMVTDTETLDGALLDRLKGMGAIVAPNLMALESKPLERTVGVRNTKRFADAGVALAIDSTLAAHREWKLFADAGVPLETIIDASTRLIAKASELAETGEIAPGYEASLYVLRCNPFEDLNCLMRVERAMERGRWVTAPARGEN